MLVDGNNAETPTETTTPGPPEEVLDENRVKVFNAREYAEFGTHKRLIYPDKSLDDWHEVRHSRRIAEAQQQCVRVHHC